MKRTARVLAALAAAAAIAFSAAFARSEGAPGRFEGYSVAESSVRELCPGVRLAEYRLKPLPGGTELRQHLFILEMDPRRDTGLNLAIGLKNGHVRGLMTLPAALAYASVPPGAAVVAGVNGDFFDMTAGGPLGYTMAGGRWITSGEFASGWALGVTETGTARIGRPGLTLRLAARRGDETVLDDVEINALNCLRADIPPSRSTPANAYQSRLDNALVLFTADYYTSTMAQDGGYEVLLSTRADIRSGETVTGTVIRVHDESADTRAGTLKVPQGMPLGKGAMALSGTGEGAGILKRLAPGDTVSISCGVDSGWADITTCLGGGRPDGGPLLVRDGAIVPEDTTVGDYAYFYSRNPRTIAGVRADGTYFMLVAEGYQTDAAGGLTITEAARMALGLGAAYALNLDGGPSSTMAVMNGKRFEVVSDAVGSRHVTAVGNSLFVFTTGGK